MENEKLRQTLEKNKQNYIDYLLKLASIDTHDIGHGIEGGLEAKGQDFMAELFASMGAEKVEKDPLNEESILKCKEKYREGNTVHNYENRYNVYASFVEKVRNLFYSTDILITCLQKTRSIEYPAAFAAGN